MTGGPRRNINSLGELEMLCRVHENTRYVKYAKGIRLLYIQSIEFEIISILITRVSNIDWKNYFGISTL